VTKTQHISSLFIWSSVGSFCISTVFPWTVRTYYQR